ncbi:MAG: hypothetical protein ABI459_05380, partial [Deltaproteobacteria bacterium]
MMFKVSVSAALCCAAAFPAVAKDYGNGFSVDGFVSLNYQTDGSGSDGLTYALGDVDLNYVYNGFGIDVSVIGQSDQYNSANALFGGLTYSFANGG